MSATLDIRQSQGFDDLTPAGRDGDSGWQRAIGVDPDSTEATRWRCAIAVIRRARAELSTSRPPEARAVGETIAQERSRRPQQPAQPSGGLGRT